MEKKISRVTGRVSFAAKGSKSPSSAAARRAGIPRLEAHLRSSKTWLYKKNRFSEENHRKHWKHEKCRNLLWISASFSCFCCFAWQFDFSDNPIPLFDGSCCFTTPLFFSTQSCETCDKSISCLQAVNRPWTLFFSWNLSDFAVSVYLLQYLFSFFLKKMPGRWSRFSPGDQRLAAKKISKFRQRSDLVLSFMTALWCDDHDGHVSKSKWLQIIMNDSFNI